TVTHAYAGLGPVLAARLPAQQCAVFSPAGGPLVRRDAGDPRFRLYSVGASSYGRSVSELDGGPWVYDLLLCPRVVLRLLSLERLPAGRAVYRVARLARSDRRTRHA